MSGTCWVEENSVDASVRSTNTPTGSLGPLSRSRALQGSIDPLFGLPNRDRMRWHNVTARPARERASGGIRNAGTRCLSCYEDPDHHLLTFWYAHGRTLVAVHALSPIILTKNISVSAVIVYGVASIIVESNTYMVATTISPTIVVTAQRVVDDSNATQMRPILYLDSINWM